MSPPPRALTILLVLAATVAMGLCIIGYHRRRRPIPSSPPPPPPPHPAPSPPLVSLAFQKWDTVRDMLRWRQEMASLDGIIHSLEPAETTGSDDPGHPGSC